MLFRSEEIGLGRKVVFGNKKTSYPVNLMKGIIVNLRSGGGHIAGEDMGKSSNVLIAMLEELLSSKSAEEKKRILTDEYGMVMTAELEGRLQIMCNLSENIEANGIKKGIKEGVRQERIDAIARMIRADATKEQIILYGYTEAEYMEVEKLMYINV